MSQTTISIRIDKDLKEKMEKTCNELGMNITTAFTIYAKKLSREGRIPFEVSIDRFYETNNLKAIDESMKENKNKKTVTKTMEELEFMENE